MDKRDIGKSKSLARCKTTLTPDRQAHAAPQARHPQFDYFVATAETLLVLSMNVATLSCSSFSDGRCAYTMWPDS